MRLTGLAAFIGGLTWSTTLIVGFAGFVDGASLFLVHAAGSGFLLVALVGLSGLRARRARWMTWLSTAVAVAGITASTFGLWAMSNVADDAHVIGPLGGWDLWIIGIVVLGVGSTMFAIAAHRSWANPDRGIAVLGIGSGLWVLGLFQAMSGGPDFGPVLALPAIGMFGIGWAAVGINANRAPRAVVTAAAA